MWRAIFDHIARFDAVAAQLAGMLKAGTLHTREDVETELDRAPAALADMYSGRNAGEKLIRLRQ